MSVRKIVLKEGDRVTKPQPGDTVKVGYTGWLWDKSQGVKGQIFTHEHQSLESKIGEEILMSGSRASTDRVLRPTQVFSGEVDWLTSLPVLGSGWEDAIPEMTIGEQATLIISSGSAYGGRGFPLVYPGSKHLEPGLTIEIWGEKGYPFVVPPNSDVAFDVVLVDIKRKGSLKWLSDSEN